MRMTPGLNFLLRGLTQVFLAPICITYLMFLAFIRVSVIQVPAWILVTSYILSVPAFVCTRVVWICIRKEREMRAMGAAPVPIIQGNLPFGLELLNFSRKGAKRGYPCASSSWLICTVHCFILRVVENIELFQSQYGNIFNAKVLGTDKVCFSVLGISSDRLTMLVVYQDCDLWSRTHQNHPRYRLPELGKEYSSASDTSAIYSLPIIDTLVKDAQKAGLGTGIFNTDGEMWK